jgi:hypothetical protein
VRLSDGRQLHSANPPTPEVPCGRGRKMGVPLRRKHVCTRGKDHVLHRERTSEGPAAVLGYVCLGRALALPGFGTDRRRSGGTACRPVRVGRACWRSYAPVPKLDPGRNRIPELLPLLMRRLCVEDDAARRQAGGIASPASRWNEHVNDGWRGHRDRSGEARDRRRTVGAEVARQADNREYERDRRDDRPFPHLHSVVPLARLLPGRSGRPARLFGHSSPTGTAGKRDQREYAASPRPPSTRARAPGERR